MRKIKLFPSPHVEIRISISDEMVRDFKECQRQAREFIENDSDKCAGNCSKCSWGDVRIGDSGVCELEELIEQLEEEA